MTKKAISILLIPLFLLTTGGFAFNMHFCKMRGIDVSLNINKSSCCGKKSMEGGCCKNEVKVIKIKDNYSASSSLTVEKSYGLVLFFATSFIAESQSGNGIHIPN